MMRLCLSLFFSTVVYAANRIVEPDFEGVNFAKALSGRRLDKVFQETSVHSETSCQIECVKNLCDSDRFTSHENFIEDEKWRYRGMESGCESDNFPCGEKGICIPDYHGKSLKCKCKPGYAGTPC
ncbi:hypothetical protein P5673_005426, partial [Acropora cervicornis]